MTETATAQGRGKLIVFGEHAVVYGQPAIACSLARGATATIRRSHQPDWRVLTDERPLQVNDQVLLAGARLLEPFGLCADELDIEVRLQIPVGAGLGSSAAMAVALARAAARLQEISPDQIDARIDQAVAASEAVFHGAASGIDQRAAMGSGFFAFQRDDGHLQIDPLTIPTRSWVIARVAPSASTAEMVSGVATLCDRHPEVMPGLIDQFGAITRAGMRTLEQGRWEDVGELMDLNHGLLAAIGVSTPALDEACHRARSAGALGAKITGAGGGGCIVALSGDDGPGPIAAALGSLGPVYSYELPSPTSMP